MQTQLLVWRSGANTPKHTLENIETQVFDRVQDPAAAVRGGDRESNCSNEATQNGATENSNSDIPRIDTI